MKVLLISHENDIDGMGNVILAKLAFEELDYLLFPSVSVLESRFRELLTEGSLKPYDKIYITDLALDNPSLKMVADDPELSQKVSVFDHHIESMNKGLASYDFTHIEEVDSNGKKRCGTELFYEHLQKSGLLSRKPIIDDFVELTRLEDTWDWTKSGELGIKAHDLAILFGVIGIDEYLSHMYRHVISDSTDFTFTQEESSIISAKKEEYKTKLRSLWEETEVFTDEFLNSYGAVFAEYQYRNDLAEFIRGLDDQKGIKYLIIIALEKGLFGQKSYRSIEPGFDVNAIASLRGGGGHKDAASVNITEGQKAMCLTMKRKESLEYLAKSSFNNN